MRFLSAFSLSIVLSLSLSGQDRSEWFEFYLPWDDSSASVTNMSAYLDAPAGKHGFLEISEDGHFKFQNSEERVKFTGVVNVAIANFPEKNLAPILAKRMAKFGINISRIHLIDVEGQYGLFENSVDNTLKLSEDRLDKMDYFIKCMKDEGIYFNFCIHAGRIYKINDGIASQIENSQSKYVTLFDKRIIELQKLFSEQTLSHVNPYTGLSYADDPAMVSVELTNENQLYNGWFGWNRDYLFADSDEGIGPYYSGMLDSMFNAWLNARYPDNDSLAKAWSGNVWESEELVTNNSFENGLNGWSTYVRTTDGAAATIDIDNTTASAGTASVHFTVQNPGTESWHIQMKTNDFQASQSKSYKIVFNAKSDSDSEFGVQIMENLTWKWIANPKFTVGEDWTSFEYYFTTPFDSDKLILQFDLGLASGNFWFDSISVTESGGIGLESTESLSEANVRRVPGSEIGKYSRRRIGDNARFYFDLEGAYIDTLSNFLKQETGIKVPITFTNNYYGLAATYSQSRADYIDTHLYWDHPNYPNGHSNTDFTLKNKPMVKDPVNSTVNRIPLNKVSGMPFVLSEYNHAYPYIYQCEAPSILYAYGSLMDLDGIIWHAYYDYMGRYSQRHQDMFFDISMHSVMMTHQMLSIPYRLGYINAADNELLASYREDDVFDNTKLYQSANTINIGDVDYGSSFLTDRFAHASFDADSTMLEGTFTDPSGVISANGGEMEWDGSTGLVKINNPYWQGATGFLKNRTLEFKDISLSNIHTTNDFGFASVHLISLDSLPISESRKLVLLTGARLENEGFLWNESQTSPVSIGGTRALSEPVSGILSLNFASRDSFRMFRLDERGQRSDTIFKADTIGNWDIDFANKTLWYEIQNDSALAPPDTVIIDTTGIGSRRINVALYPNPCSDHLMIRSEIPIQEITVYGLRGQVLQTELAGIINAAEFEHKLSTQQLPDGMYFCQVRMRDKSSAMKMFIKLSQDRIQG